METVEKHILSLTEYLRGKMNAEEYKDYILCLICYYDLSLKMDDDIDIGFIIPKDIRATTLLCNQGFILDLAEMGISTISKEFSRLTNNDIPLFEALNVKMSKIGDIHEQNETLLYVLDRIASLKVQSDLGQVYEILLKQFSSGASSKYGEFYTPPFVSELHAKLVISENTKSIYDPTCGSGALFLQIKGKYKIHGQELNRATFNLCRMNLLMKNVQPSDFSICWGDVLVNPQHVHFKFDAILSNPPYSVAWDIEKTLYQERWQGIPAPRLRSDLAFVQHSIYCLADHGVAGFVLPMGVLFRGNNEQKIRKKLIDDNLIDAIICLPTKLFYSTDIPTMILLIKKNRENKDILFIDATKTCDQDKKKNTLTSHHIEKIVDTYRNRLEENNFSICVSIDTIQENDYNLSLGRYLSIVDESQNEKINFQDLYLQYKKLCKESAELDKKIEESMLNLFDTEGNKFLFMREQKND